jgi:hypothetical protein
VRKALTLTLLLLAISIGGICFAHISVNGARDQVVLTEDVLYGDKTIAAGLKIRLDTHYDYRLFWNIASTIAAGAEPRCDTEYTFSSRELRQDPPVVHSGVVLNSGVPRLDMYLNEEQTGINVAYRELSDETPLGEDNAKVINLKDYYDYYPLTVSLGFPGTDLAWPGTFWADITDPDPGTETYVILAFRDFFKIPVIEDEQIEISVRKGADGRGTSYGLGSTDSDSFRIRSESALTDDACYFTFTTRTSHEDIVDTSLIPGGYGIYRLPYFDGKTPSGRICGAKIDELSMVYPLDPSVEILDLGVHPQKTRLSLHAVENRKYVLTVIDIATMTAVQRIEVFDWPEDKSDWWVYEGDGFLTAVLSGYGLAVVAVDEEGGYDLRFTAEITDGEGPLHLETEAVMDYDGSRLAVADFARKESGRYTCDFYLAVYDKSGLAYYGVYKNSLSTGYGPDKYYDRCVPVDYGPIAVKW